jgi:hypothetical protein
MEVRDRNGNLVTVGSHVRVLSIAPLDLSAEPAEVERVQSMLGQVFEVYEIDPYGRAWVEKWWHLSPDQSISHSLALESKEMELSAPVAGS